jgi:proteasome lid subunit RPN8/RPN11
MSDDIQFGDVEEVQPEKNLRPDRNRHFAVVAYGKPSERDLPIFVDLDVLLDMEAHAASDKTVELGGVMLGGHYHDENGQPFVVVTDTLRAEHYESTKGSFKFTHETWETISRQRDEFPPELQMAGWYHTHPDWGVFLSGMDMFICDNFFNKMLDVAYVIDPCRLDRAFFQWTGKPSERIRRTGGFYVTASRFREQELATTVAALEGKIQMPTYTGGAGGSPIINVQSPHPPPKPVWETAGTFGMLALQF